MTCLWSAATLLWTLLSSLDRVSGKFVAKIATIEVNETDYTFALPRSGPAINIALRKVGERYKDSIEFHLRFRSNTCDEYKIGALAADVYYNEGVTAFIGPVCETALEALGHMAADWNLPVITPAGNINTLRGYASSSTTTKLSPFGLKQFAEFAENILMEYNWRHIALLYDNSDRSAISSRMARAFLQYFRTSTYDVTHIPLTKAELTTQGFRDALTVGSENARVFIMHLSMELVRELLLVAHDLGYTSGDYVFLVTISLRATVSAQVWQRGDERDADALAAFQSVYFLALKEQSTVRYKKFELSVINNALQNWDLDFGEDDPGNFITGYHDAVIIYAQVLDEIISEGGDPTDGRAITQKIWGRTFLGIAGNVTIDESGNRHSDLSFLDVNPQGLVRAVGRFGGRTKTFRTIPGRTITWLRGVPMDVPVCGFKGLRCKYKVSDVTLVGGLSATLIAVVLATGLAAVYYRCRSTSALPAVDKWWWKVENSDITFSGREETQSFGSYFSKFSCNTRKSDSMHSHNERIAFYKSCPARLRKLELDMVVVDEALLEEFLHIRDMNLDNLLRIYGASLHEDCKYLVTEFCPRGSLQDIVGNSEFSLDAQFKFSLCLDVLKGMSYLHEGPLKKHGRLTSAVCLVDNCFSVKIADYGPHTLFNQIKVRTDSQEYKRECLWRAPELLRTKDMRGSRQGDVYSLGIILQEVFSRDSPFASHTEALGIDAVIRLVKQGGDEPLRPEFDVPRSLAGIHELMKQCWSEDPRDRPALVDVKRDYKQIAARFGASGNMFDNLLRRMEQYANNLEKLVDEKTHRVREEKKRSEELLHQIIPKSVANQIKMGKRVQPDVFESVTVCFTDICGFTHLSAQSTPMQVVDLLNDLYSCFDDIIDGYDVYKVETIGDAYMVVSGLPVRNGDAHAPEISRMSLTLLRATETIKISHLPNSKLKLRVGIHTGPVCAGVVGQKMPRYCLFGETVITASRMESSGEACRIHISVDTKTVLDRCGIFIIGSRGTISVKGIGQLTTYWLLGEKIWNR